MAYQNAIATMTRLNPAGVEASMRVIHDHPEALSVAMMQQEIALAEACERIEPGYLRSCAEAFGYGDDYERWERERLRMRAVFRLGGWGGPDEDTTCHIGEAGE